MNHLHDLESAKMEMEELPLRHPSPGSAFRHADPQLVRSRTTKTFRAASGVLMSILSFIKPSFIGPYSSEPRKLHPTSYLDGLRGVAALFVVFAHYQATFIPYLGPGWHQKGQWEDGTEKANNYIVQLPIIRTFYAARFMVSIFFVISGYVLSQKSLGLATRREYTPLIQSLSSSVFRRFLRLMLPALTASFLTYLLACFNFPTELSKGWDVTDLSVADLSTKAHPLYNSDSVTFSDWIEDATVLTDPFRFGKVSFPKYDYPLWTMQVEYMGSMVVFIVVVGTSHVRRILRCLLLAFLVWYCFWSGRWQWCLFIGGVLIADLAYISPPLHPESYLPLAERMDEDEDDTTEKEEESGKLPPPSFWSSLRTFLNLETYSTRLKVLSPYFSPVWYLVSTLIFFLAIFLGSFPDGPPSETATAPGYGWLSQFMPSGWWIFQGYFFPDIGALLLVFILSKAEFLQKIFTTRIAQYLGDISLSIYMLHVLVLMTLGNWLIVKCLVVTRGLGDWGFSVGITMAFSCCAIATFWAGDIFWRLVDTKCIQFAKWVSNKVSVK